MKWYTSARVALSECILITISLKANLDKNDIYPLAETHLGSKSTDPIFLGDTKLFTNSRIIRMRTHIRTAIIYMKHSEYILNLLYLGRKRLFI